MRIYLMDNTDSFRPHETSSATVGELREELGASGASINVNNVVADDATILVADAIVAVVRADKVGG